MEYPICFAAPRGKQEPFCLDVTTFIPWNKILENKEKGLNLEREYAVDEDGTRLKILQGKSFNPYWRL